ncbi:MAG TPA: hypothetical protein QF700_07505, partial [Prochlorococcus sp.]|nr:hypothetical protein [Prochlorococcus sp.]
KWSLWLRWRWHRAACASSFFMPVFTNYGGVSRSKIEPCKGLATGFDPQKKELSGRTQGATSFAVR